MIKIEHIENPNEEFYRILEEEFEKFAIRNDVICNYMPINFVAKDGEKIIGVLSGHSYYKEIHISSLIILEEYRNKHIGSKLIEEVERYYKDKGFENINLTTYVFQALEFYKKGGFQIEYVREDKENPKLTKYFLIKYF